MHGVPFLIPSDFYPSQLIFPLLNSCQENHWKQIIEDSFAFICVSKCTGKCTNGVLYIIASVLFPSLLISFSLTLFKKQSIHLFQFLFLCSLENLCIGFVLHLIVVFIPLCSFPSPQLSSWKKYKKDNSIFICFCWCFVTHWKLHKWGPLYNY